MQEVISCQNTQTFDIFPSKILKCVLEYQSFFPTIISKGQLFLTDAY